MFNDPSWSKITYSSDYRGEANLPSPESVRVPWCLSAKNFQFEPGKIIPRPGYEDWEADAQYAITDMVDWTYPSFGNYVLAYDAAYGIRLLDLSTLTWSNIYAKSGKAGAVFQVSGNRVYVCFLDADGFSTEPAVVVGYNGSSFYANTIFHAPMVLTLAAPSEPSTGEVTAGIHKLAFLLHYQDGSVLQISSHSSSSSAPNPATFTPVQFTATGGKNLSWTVNPGGSWPTGAIAAEPVMTPVFDRALFLRIPGQKTAISGSTPVVFTIDISDDTLIRAQEDNSQLLASERLLYWTQSTGGSPTHPFYPHSISQYGDRTVYLTRIDDGNGELESAIIFSERNRAQGIKLETGLLQVQRKLPAKAAGELNDGSYHIFSDGLTQYTTETFDSDPIAWPVRVANENHGTASANGIAVNKTLGVIWVADKSGLYAYDGSYSTEPASYRQQNLWDTINWTKPDLIRVVDDAQNKVVHVFAPVSGSGTVNAWWTFDYREGVSWKKISFSPHTMPAYSFAGAAMVRDFVSVTSDQRYSKPVLVLFPRTNAFYLRTAKSPASATRYRDGTSEAITYNFRSATPPPLTGSLKFFGYGGWISGSGELKGWITDKDGARIDQLPDSGLSSSPGEPLYAPGEAELPTGCVELQTSKADSWFSLSSTVEIYWMPWSAAVW